METYRAYVAATRRVSVDGAADGYLDGCRLAFANAGVHHSTHEAIDNVLPRVRRRQFGVMLVGHGNEGVLTTGCGQHGLPTAANCVTLANVNSWRAEFARLRHNTRAATLLGCFTGAGPSGLALLREVACAIEGRAVGPTGIVWALGDGKIRLALGSRWQTVTCDGLAIPLPPAMNLTDIKRRFTAAGQRSDEPGLGIVTDVRFVPREGLGTQAAHFEGVSAEALMRLVKPFPHVVPNGGPLAIITGTIHLTEMDEAGRARERDFVVYADRLLQDQRAPALFFEGSRRFAEELRASIAPRGEDAPGGALSGSR